MAVIPVTPSLKSIGKNGICKKNVRLILLLILLSQQAVYWQEAMFTHSMNALNILSPNTKGLWHHYEKINNFSITPWRYI